MRIHPVLLALSIVGLSINSVAAQVPDSIAVQGMITDTGGTPVDSTGVSTTFTLYKNGSPVWTETKAIDVSSGVFNTQLGSVTPLDTVAFNVPIQLGIKLDGEAGEFSPRASFVSAPYARAIPGMYSFARANATYDARNVIGGSSLNNVTSDVTGATISGGGGVLLDGGPIDAPNSVQADFGTIGGGINNTAFGVSSTIAGGSGNQTYGTATTIGGGGGNGTLALTTGYATIAGGLGNGALEDYTTVGGGQSNMANAANSTIAGGSGNQTNDAHATVGGGQGNNASGEHSTIAGGENNGANGDNSFIGGGQLNSANGNWAVVAGGYGNGAGTPYAAVGGGYQNMISTGATFATIAGGEGNQVNDDRGAIGGGSANQTSGSFATIGGGQDNTATATHSTVGGGSQNKATGAYATVPGGRRNSAEGYTSFAAGFVAKAGHNGSFVWQDSSGTFTDTLKTTGSNQFVARASGGVTFYTNPAPSSAAGVTLGPGLGAWAPISDVNAKTGFGRPDPQQVLETLSTVPIRTWRYTGENASNVHIGPTAQDFYAAFGYGIDDKHIVTVDADGVALAAIQGLYELVKEQQAEIERLRSMIEER